MKSEGKVSWRQRCFKHLPEFILLQRPVLWLIRQMLGRPWSIAILGGTFDPFQRAHLAVARRVANQANLDLDMLLVVVSGDPVLKAGVTPAEIRYEMAQVSVKRENKVRASRLEMHNGKSYTVVTLRRLKKLFGADAQLNFIIGSDKIEELPSWDYAAEIIRLCRLLVIPRNAGNNPDQYVTRLIEKAMPGATFAIIAGEPLPNSSTEVRRLRGLGQPIDHLVPEGIPEIIEREGLYLKGDMQQVVLQPTRL